jgi:hypothetical protein
MAVSGRRRAGSRLSCFRACLAEQSRTPPSRLVRSHPTVDRPALHTHRLHVSSILATRLQLQPGRRQFNHATPLLVLSLALPSPPLTGFAMYPPHPQKITERDRVLFKKFGSDLPPSQHQMNNPPVSPTSKPTPTDQSWQDLHFPVQNGGGMEDGLGGVMLAFSGSGEGSMTGSSRKKAKPDTGIAPWLSDAGDFGVSQTFCGCIDTAYTLLTRSFEALQEPHASSSSTTSMTTPKLSHSPSAPHLSASSPGEPSSKISSRSPVNLISRSRPSNASSLLSSPVNDRTRPASKSAKGGISGSGEKSPPGVPPVVPEEKRKKSVFSGLGLMKRKTPAVAKGKDDGTFRSRSTCPQASTIRPQTDGYACS